MLMPRIGELPTVIKIEPNISTFIENFVKYKRPDSERHNAIKQFLEDKNNVWALKIFNLIKNISMDLFNEDLSSMFEQTKMSTSTATIIKNNTSNTTNIDESYNSKIIKLSVNNQFLNVPQFLKIVNVLKRLNFDKVAMCKITFSFNNINTCISIFNPNKDSDNTLIINARSKRYLNENTLKKCEDLISYLNKLIKENTDLKLE